MIKYKKIIITTEKDRCIYCKKQVYKDRFITKTKKGYICEKCKAKKVV